MDADALAIAARTLGRLWLQEISEEDLPALRAMPGLAEPLIEPAEDAELVEALAVEYQRLLGFNLPPYESVFLDATAMLQARSTARVSALYRAADWAVPADLRIGAEDHIGVELLAFADLLAAGREAPARRLLDEHLALWVPLFVEALRRLEPAAFYDALAALTLGLVLGRLEASGGPEGGAAVLPPLDAGVDPLPTGEAADAPTRAILDAAWQDAAQQPVAPPRPLGPGAPGAAPEPGPDEGPGLRELVRELATPRRAGLFISRRDIAELGRLAELPSPAGERRRMLEGLLRAAGNYDAVMPVVAGLLARLDEAEASYRAWAETWPSWSVVAEAWCARLADTRQQLQQARERSEADTGPLPAPIAESPWQGRKEESSP